MDLFSIIVVLVVASVLLECLIKAVGRVLIDYKKKDIELNKIRKEIEQIKAVGRVIKGGS
jgi:Co/Zn/Cd efflux system component